MSYKSLLGFIGLSLGLVYLGLHSVRAQGNAAFLVGGQDAVAGTSPWMAAVKEESTNNFLCGGVLITLNKILTSKKCVDSYAPISLKVVLGEQTLNQYDGTEQPIGVRRVNTHPNADLAVLVLQVPALINSQVSIIRLASSLPAVGQNLSISGWGSLVPGLPLPSNFLQQLQVPRADEVECSAQLKIQSFEFCGGSQGADIKAVCSGDAGGPVTTVADDRNPQLVGIVAMMPDDCSFGVHYGRYTSIPDSNIRDWIQSCIDSVQCKVLDITTNTPRPSTRPRPTRPTTPRPSRRRTSRRSSKRQPRGCFPPKARIRLQSGEKKSLEDVEVGDKVLSMTTEGTLTYSDVMMMMHQSNEGMGLYQVLHTDRKGISLRLTPEHMVLVQVRGDHVTQYKLARNVRVGDSVFVVDDVTKGGVVGASIINITTAELQGMYAPLTREGTMIVDDVVASCYAYLENQDLCHAAFSPARLLHSWFPNMFKYHSHPTENIIHWYPDLLQRYVGPVLGLAGIPLDSP